MYLQCSICINFRVNISNCKLNSSKTDLLYEKCTHAGVYILVVSNISPCDNVLHFRYLRQSKILFNFHLGNSVRFFDFTYNLPNLIKRYKYVDQLRT